MAQGTRSTTRRSTRTSDPLNRVNRAVEKATDRELKRVDTLTAKLRTETAARIAELDRERATIVAMREALGLDGEPKRRGRPPRTDNGAGS